MKYRKLGRTDISVSVVSLGCWSLISDNTWGSQDRNDSVGAIHAALDAGINFFDTAEGYGHGASEELLSEVLFPSQPRESVIIASKVGAQGLRPTELVRHCEDSLSRLKTDYIDLYQIHWPNPDVPISDTLGALEQLEGEGKIRAVGVSNFGRSYLEELLDAGRSESNQLCYNLLWRAIEHEIQPICLENEMSILCYSSLCQGLLTGKFASADEVPESRARTRLFSKDRLHSRHNQPGCEEETFSAIAGIRAICESIGRPMGQVALAWLLAQPGVTSVIAGARSADQAGQNALAAEVELDVEVIEKLDRATRKVKNYVGSNADVWQHDSRMER